MWKSLSRIFFSDLEPGMLKISEIATRQTLKVFHRTFANITNYLLSLNAWRK
jgi:uncharacterized membrane protein